MHATRHSAITLVVTNSERLEGRSTSSHVFHEVGGTLGSGGGDDWLLQDHAGRIQPGHAELQRQDGRFCLVDRSGQTFVNHATLPIGRDRRVALRDGDELLVGEYRLRVHLGDRQASQPGAQPLAALVTEEQEALDGSGTPLKQAVTARHDDPLEALGESTPGARQRDPLSALADPASDEETVIDVLDSAWDEPQAPGDKAYDLHDRRQAAMRMPAIKQREEKGMDRSTQMDERLLDDLERSVGEQLEDRWHEPATTAAGHVGADPLLRAMGAELHFRDSAEQQAFLQEAGNTLRATIEGLQALHQAQDDSRYPLRDRRLQPIEDNPLRLGQPYRETVSTLFAAERSPVHLSAPAAVAECLAHQGQHQAAVEDAIGEALQAILSAFAPEALLKRFHAYRGAGNRIEDEGGWAWEMYRHYFQELNSGRQQGFEKLFWEVFEQAYDQSVRRQQREGA
ncbi:type VI secretion system-associated FHA domain protein TagH [Halomonas sp. ML-15]|uniref:type VI secretion system-associated FHA domain protein TagH n=1 Tax=Halomonas sp. ML-15 TaxID=2773305 RepID=UPI0017474DE7|nr:type VI secretion system-associated FHA domain protein TagH [Halomonas sp. ML-15]MBD3896010.1 type VI secretion system-associated FHA domain protein TagH [Halomonas sp. ML-15]